MEEGAHVSFSTHSLEGALSMYTNTLPAPLKTIHQTLRRHLATTSYMAIAVVALSSAAAHADSGKDAKPPAAWSDGIKVSAQINAGGTYNSSNPKDNKNFGRLFDDKSDKVLLNQVLLTAQRPTDDTIKGYDYGFKLQGMYGSDARYTHFLREFQRTAGDRTNQFDVVEAYVQMHTPWFTEGGFDIKVGQYVTLEGAETIDPSTNYFYSHSYIFNFGIPFKHTGVMTKLRATPILDIYAGVDTGVNTGLGGSGDNNDAVAFHGAIGLNLLGGNLTLLASTHIGPEISKKAVENGLLPNTVRPNSDMRYLNDITTVWKVTDKLTLINDLNWIRDEALNAGKAADGYGIAQYGVYALNDVFSLVARGEVFRDLEGVFVTQSGNNVDFARGLEGLPALSARSVAGGKTTYGALTLGVNIKPALGIPQIADLRIRPEVRYDTSLNDTRPFNDSKDKSMFTVGMDVIVAF